MRFKGLDLNLLVALDALLDERSVSRAAERLHVSQPAMSAALTRMREYFGDPILKLHGRQMVPTSHAVRIHPKLKALLRDIDVIVSETSTFDPIKSDRRFRVGVSDYIMAILFSDLLRECQTTAPNIKIECVPPSDDLLPQLNQGTLDLIIVPDNQTSDEHPSELLFKEKYVVVGCAKNSRIKNGRISKSQFEKAGHISVEIGTLRRTSFAEHHLQKLGVKRRIELHVSSFLAAPELVVGTERLAVVHERLATLFAERLDIAVAKLPFTFPVMDMMMQFHQTREEDPALIWLRENLTAHAGRRIKKSNTLS